MIRLPEKDAHELARLLREFAAFRKEAAPGEVLTTRAEPADDAPPLALDREGFRRAVRAADFMAACAPDNAGRPWSPERMELASRLRALYWEEFGENVYAG